MLILNNVHFFKNDDDGKNMLLQFQQRAEAWAASGTSFCGGSEPQDHRLPLSQVS